MSASIAVQVLQELQRPPLPGADKDKPLIEFVDVAQPHVDALTTCCDWFKNIGKDVSCCQLMALLCFCKSGLPAQTSTALHAQPNKCCSEHNS
jgi:hypothetical protein